MSRAAKLILLVSAALTGGLTLFGIFTINLYLSLLLAWFCATLLGCFSGLRWSTDDSGIRQVVWGYAISAAPMVAWKAYGVFSLGWTILVTVYGVAVWMLFAFCCFLMGRAIAS